MCPLAQWWHDHHGSKQHCLMGFQSVSTRKTQYLKQFSDQKLVARLAKGPEVSLPLASSKKLLFALDYD